MYLHVIHEKSVYLNQQTNVFARTTAFRSSDSGKRTLFADLNEPCTLLTGGPGVCREVTSCPAVAKFAHVREVKFCGRRGRLALVCCPQGESTL